MFGNSYETGQSFAWFLSDESKDIGSLKATDTELEIRDSAFSFTDITSSGYDNSPVGFLLVSDGVSAVPLPAGVWLMGSGLLGLIGFSRKTKPSVVTS